MRLRDVDEGINRVTGAIVDSAIAVQRELGSGLLERPYELALQHELRLRGHLVERQVHLEVEYRGLRVPDAYAIDLDVDGLVLVEVKAVEALDPQHFAQLRTYLRFSGRRVGLLVNFRAYPLKTGIHRVVAT